MALAIYADDERLTKTGGYTKSLSVLVSLELSDMSSDPLRPEVTANLYRHGSIFD